MKLEEVMFYLLSIGDECIYLNPSGYIRHAKKVGEHEVRFYGWFYSRIYHKEPESIVYKIIK